MGSQARTAFEENCQEIDRLSEIHTEVAGPGPGRIYKVEALHKAAIVLLTAFWEAFCEDLAAEGLQHLVAHGTASSLPTELRKLVAKELREAKHDLAIWDLADEGWRMVLTRRLKRLQDDRNRKLNSPKSYNINELFENTVGIKEISNAWYWSKMSAVRAVEKLDDYIETRGAIAHCPPRLLRQQCEKGLGYRLLQPRVPLGRKDRVESP
ncbi:HEPN domain-containing protein [Actinoallomurus sp. NPDC050550]|uniref:HEPN domain-containing protein n=1 Tax=Actinoallomurus sp. NPDC050550 TaxID=3154937 RepID=UPI0033D5DB73